MTRKDYKLIAEVINNLGFYSGDVIDTAIKFADKLEVTYSNFDREKFLTACGAN